jgi:hypothetical protein
VQGTKLNNKDYLFIFATTIERLMGNSIFRFLLILCFSLIFYIYTSGVVYLDSDTENVADLSEVKSSGGEERPVPEGTRDTSGEEISPSIVTWSTHMTTEQETRGASEETTFVRDANIATEHQKLGIPKNELTNKEKLEIESLTREANQLQMLVDRDIRYLEIAREEQEGTKEEIQERILEATDKVASFRESAQKEILALSNKIEAIKLKESPTDIGDILKKRKAG